MDRLYLGWNITHSFPIEEIGCTGFKSRHWLILLGVFTSVIKTLLFLLLWGLFGAQLSHARSVAHRQRVKWRERVTRKRCLLPSVSLPRGRWRVSPVKLPVRSPDAWPAEGAVRRRYTDLSGLWWHHGGLPEQRPFPKSFPNQADWSYIHAPGLEMHYHK